MKKKFSGRKPPQRDRQDGAALLLVLWAVGVICIAVVGLTSLTQEAIETETEFQHADRARHLAESGLAILSCPGIENGDPVLTQAMPGGGSFTAYTLSEGGRLQINAVLQKRDRTVLQRLFLQWGLTSMEADTVIDCMLDWVNPLPGRRLNGAGINEYIAAGLRFGPTGKEFISVEQMAQVLHFDLLTRKKSNWREFFTVWTKGNLDINAAPADLVAAATGAARSKAAEMVTYLSGPDGIPNTRDDLRFASLDEARLFLGIAPDVWASLPTPLSLDSTIQRMISTGKSGSIQTTLSVVVSRATSSPTVLESKQL